MSIMFRLFVLLIVLLQAEVALAQSFGPGPQYIGPNSPLAVGQLTIGSGASVPLAAPNLTLDQYGRFTLTGPLNVLGGSGWSAGSQPYGFGALNGYFFSNASLTGLTGNQPLNILQFNENETTPNANIVGWYVNHTVVAGSTGARTAVYNNLTFTGATANISDVQRQYTTESNHFGSAYNEGGTGLGVSQTGGVGQAGNDVAELFSGATYWTYLQGREIDWGVRTGASVGYKYGLSLVLTGGDGVQGSLGDAGINFVRSSSTSPGLVKALTFGRATAYWPLAASGTIIGTEAASGAPFNTVSYAAAYGIDFSAVTFSSGFLKSTGFSVDGLGKTVTAGLTLPQTTPANSSATCTTGNIYADASYIYACTATNTWKRAALSAF